MQSWYELPGVLMLKILKQSDVAADWVTFSLSGRIRLEDVPELRTLLESEHRKIILDLGEVKIVHREAVRFLALCEQDGIQLKNCPAYVLQWIVSERSGEVRMTMSEEEEERRSRVKNSVSDQSSQTGA